MKKILAFCIIFAVHPGLAQTKPRIMHVTAIRQGATQTVCDVVYEKRAYTLNCTATRLLEVGGDYEVVYLKNMPGFGTFMKVILAKHPDGLILPVIATKER
jgi:hypothetical protein